jgi:hypothetical protein
MYAERQAARKRSEPDCGDEQQRPDEIGHRASKSDVSNRFQQWKRFDKPFIALRVTANRPAAGFRHMINPSQ